MNTENLELMQLKDLPNLHAAPESPKELSSEYWTPEKAGDYVVGVVIGVVMEKYQNTDSGEEIDLPCVVFISQKEDGTFSTIRNGSKRLVATIEKAIESGDVQAGQTPVKITFVGNEKNKTNSFKSDRWSVKPLIIG